MWKEDHSRLILRIFAEALVVEVLGSCHCTKEQADNLPKETDLHGDIPYWKLK